MANPANSPDPVIITDGRQSEIAANIQRGTCRFLEAAGFASITELTLPNGRRADIAAISSKGEVWIVEIKSSPADYLSDKKWHEYRDYCDRLLFAITADMDAELIDNNAGLIIADAWGADIIRHAPEHKLASARRKAMTLLMARTGALRLQYQADPNAGQAV